LPCPAIVFQDICVKGNINTVVTILLYVDGTVLLRKETCYLP